MVSIGGPLVLAAWFGVFLTALNLMPVGQLDGGHAVYALLRRQAAWIYRLGIAACVALVYVSPTWILWATLLLLFGRQHPTTLDDEAPVGRGRAWVGLITLVVFVLCFMPQPILMSWSDFVSPFFSTSP